VAHEYRVFLVHQGDEWTFIHASVEKLRDGQVVRVSKPGTPVDGRVVTLYSVLTHPSDGRPGIAYGRAQLIDAQAGAFIESPEGRTDSQTKGVSVSTQEQDGEQGPGSPMEPDSPREPTPGEPGTMPEEPRTAPDAPTMPEEPDLAPPESPEESSNS
jgi:hypothetical protein